MIFSRPKTLSRLGVMGMNSRNGEIILPFNERKRYPLVDDKVKTKKLALAAGLPVPPLYGIIEYAGQVKNFSKIVEDHREFVIKPARGSGGHGIIVIKDRLGQHYQKANGELISEADLRFHIHNALGGVYSLGGQPDAVLIEYCVQFDPVFEKVAYQGIPDIRVIVFLGIPIMAMVRLPTRMSDGRANLHQGAIGVGIDMQSGRTLRAVWNNAVVAIHPDTKQPITDLQIPDWHKILKMSARTYDLVGLGYIGVDIVLDRDLGPLILELNARPGLNIQIANEAGLRPRLELTLAKAADLVNVDQRVEFSLENFAADKPTAAGQDIVV